MKKLLLFAAAAVAFGASAQTLTQMWKVKTEGNASLPTNEVRQGVGMNGKIYINNKADQKVYVVDKDGVSATTLPGGKNCGINRDQAGNLMVSDAGFPNSWIGSPVIKVYNPQTPENVTELVIPEDIPAGRCDFLGIGTDDLTADGKLLLTFKDVKSIYRLGVSGGEVSKYDSFKAVSDEGLAYTNEIVINPFNDGQEIKYLYVYRSGAPAIIVGDENDENFTTEKSLNLENKGASNGAEIFTLGGKKYIVYPAAPNYSDGFAIGCLDDEPGEKGLIKAIVQQKEEYAKPNGINANWLNVEPVSNTEATIYQYVPGAYCAAYSFKIAAEQTGINDVNATKDVKVRKVYENGQVYIIKGDVKYNVMGAQVK